MNLTIDTEQLRNALQTVRGSISRYITLEILSHVLLRADDDWLSFSTTNLDTTVCCTVPCKVKEPGAATVPHKRLLDLIENVERSEVLLNSKDSKSLNIAAESTVTLNGLQADEFPHSQTFKDASAFNIPQTTLKQLLTQTAFAMSVDEKRYVLNGVFLALKENQLTSVATDSRRINIAKAEVEGHNCEMILPAKTVHQLISLLTEDSMIGIEVIEPDWVRFTIGSVVLISKTIDGNFPNYKNVIPDNQVRVNVPRVGFLKAVARAAAFTTEKASTVKLHFTKNNLAVSIASPVGHSLENLPVNYSERELQIRFYAPYLTDVLNVLSEESVCLELPKIEIEPIMIKSGSFLCVIMPMRD